MKTASKSLGGVSKRPLPERGGVGFRGGKELIALSSDYAILDVNSLTDTSV